MQVFRIGMIVLALAVTAVGAGAQTPPTPPPVAVLGGSAALSASAVSSRVALPASNLIFAAVTLLNEGTTKAFFALGGATVTATTSSTPLAAGQSMTVWVGANTYVAAVTASSTTTVTVYQANGPVSLRGTGGAASLTVGTTAISGGTNGNVLYDNSGVLGELALVGLARGGTNADLSATGGASQVLRQSSAGGAITVSQLAQADISGLTTASTPTFAGLALAGGTVAASTPILNGTQTWNNAGVTFTGFKLNVTDSASAAASLLLDLQVGASSVFSVSKAGAVTMGTLQNSVLYTGGNTVNIWNGGAFSFSSTTSPANAADLALWRDAAGALAQRNGTNAQIFRVYNTYTDAANYERFKIEWNGSLLYMGTEAAGTGTQRGVNINGSVINFRIGQTTDRWQIDTSAFFKPATDNVYDIGTASLRPRNIYVGTNFIVPGGATAVLKSAATITSGAGAATGTLTNAPTAGNPTSWIPINDNGTTRYIPAW